MQQRVSRIDSGLLLQRNPDIGWVTAQSFTKEPRSGDADDSERMSIEHESGASHGRISAIRALQGMVAEHDDGRGGRLVVVFIEHTSAKRAYAERREIVSGYELRAQRPGRSFHALTPHA